AVAAGTVTPGSLGASDESTAFTMNGLTNGQAYTISGLTVTASKTLTATEVASAFVNGVTSAGNYVVTGTLVAPATWTGNTFTSAGAVLTLTDTGGQDNVTDFTTVTNNAAGTSPTDATIATTQGAAVAGALTLSNMANNGTLELTAAGTGVNVTMTDATSLTADSFNIITKVAGDLNFGTVAVAGVETVKITATDTTPTVSATDLTATINTSTLTLSDAAAKSVVIDGNAHLSLTATGASLTSVNASNLTGNSSAVNSATITGGNGVDTLTATGTSQTLIGGAGNDVLKGGDLSTLTGGAGADIFKMNVSTNVNSYATITDFLAGDVIDLDAADAGTVVFTAAAITLASTAVFQDYANAAARALTTDGNNASWFQYTNAGVTSTYIVQSGDTTTNDFQNGVDSIIKITGAVDLSTASYNQTNGTLELA
ncbi:MAG: hypothetical protein B7Y30_09750, partial [Campylobacterales bacterium 16-40-21]